MSEPEVFNEFRARWTNAVHAVAGQQPSATTEWRDLSAIAAVLNEFAQTNNHLHFPDGGGHDLREVQTGSEPGTLEFVVTDGLVYLAKPARLTLEYVETSPSDSFIIIDLDRLDPSGAYEDDDANERHPRGEELVELSRGHYEERGVWDAGYWGYDADGREEPLPKGARLLHRFFDGRFMLVTKGSLWNSTPATYDGRHDRMTNGEIRDAIEHAVANA